MVEKREQTQTLNFFLVLTCFSARSHSLTHLLERTPKVTARKLSSPYIFVACVLLTSLPYHFSPPTLDRTVVVPKLPPVVSGKAFASTRSVHAHTLLGPPVLLSHFLITRIPWSSYSKTTICFIYLCIYSFIQFQFSINRSIIYICTITSHLANYPSKSSKTS